MKRAFLEASKRLAKLPSCQYGATAAEYAIGAAMIVAAWSSSDVPRALSGTFTASASEQCAPTSRGTTARWERPALRCTSRPER